MKNSKRKFNLILHSVLAIVLTCAIIIAAVLFVNGAVAWFAKNRRVDANGMAVNLKDLGITPLYYIRYDKRGTDFVQTGNGIYTFSDIAPGDTVTIKAIYLSDEYDERTLDIHFKDFDGDGEDPLVKDGKYYYFGTQLKLTQKAINGGTADSVNTFLVTPPENKIYYTETAPAPTEYKLAEGLAPVNTTDINLGVTLDDNLIKDKKVRMVEFTVEFVNYTDIDQNDYQHFGSKNSDGTSNGKCERQLVAYVN